MAKAKAVTVEFETPTVEFTVTVTPDGGNSFNLLGDWLSEKANNLDSNQNEDDDGGVLWGDIDLQLKPALTKLVVKLAINPPPIPQDAPMVGEEQKRKFSKGTAKPRK